MNLEFIDVPDMLGKMGIENISPRGNEIQFSCPFPEHLNGDRNPSNSMSEKSTVWHCFGCHRSGNAITFVSMFENISPMQAFMWLNEAYNKSYISHEHSAVRELEEMFKPKQLNLNIEVNKPIDSGPVKTVDWDKVAAEVKQAPKALAYMLDRNFSPSTLNDCQISYDPISDRVAIPINNANGELVGYKARTPYNSIQPRYLVLGDRGNRSRYNFSPCKVSLEVFNIHRYEGGSVVICEGELNAMMLTQYGYNAIALSGSSPSKAQVDVISRKFDEVVLFLDSDNAGKSCSDYLSQQLAVNCFVRVVADHEGDPCSMKESECHELIEGSISYLESVVLNCI